MEALKTTPPQFKPLDQLVAEVKAAVPKDFKPAQVVGHVTHNVAKAVVVRPAKPAHNGGKQHKPKRHDEVKDYSRMTNQQQLQELVYLKSQLSNAKKDRQNAEDKARADHGKVIKLAEQIDELIASMKARANVQTQDFVQALETLRSALIGDVPRKVA
jgi:hypothetical protein